jgi:hypothetical protein
MFVDVWAAAYWLVELWGWKLALAVSVATVLIFSHHRRGKGWF